MKSKKVALPQGRQAEVRIEEARRLGFDAFVQRRLLISAAQGPLECELAVERATERIEREAASLGLVSQVLHRELGRQHLRSCVLGIEGRLVKLQPFVESWLGTLLWVWESPHRGSRSRKNFYIGVFLLEDEALFPQLGSKLQYRCCRASGKGGQNVNKRSTAVHAFDPQTALRVKVQDERRQGDNKRLARARLEALVEMKQAERAAQSKAKARLQHWRLERGRPRRSFVGPDFIEASKLS